MKEERVGWHLAQTVEPWVYFWMMHLSRAASRSGKIDPHQNVEEKKEEEEEQGAIEEVDFLCNCYL